MKQATEADIPKQLPRPYRVRIFARAIWRLRGTDPSALAAEAAYFSILAIAPFFLFLISGIALISQVVPIALVEDLESMVSRMAPGNTGELLLPLVEEAVERTGSGMLSFGVFSSIIVATWSGARAIASLMKGSARMSSEQEPRPLIWNRMIALGLAIILGLSLIVSIALVLFGRGIGRAIAEAIQMGDTFALIWIWVSWPLMGVIVLLMLSLFYWFATEGYSKQLHFISPGAIVATVLWVLVMLGIRIFLWIIDPGSVYGALGSFVVLVVFFYIMSLALLFGAAVNAEVNESSQPETS